MSVMRVVAIFSTVISVLLALHYAWGQKEGECKEENKECNQKRKDVRSNLLFPKHGLTPGKPFPRIHVKDIYKPENKEYLYRMKAFMLIGAADDWKAVSELFLQGGKRLVEWFPRAVVDFYPMNMLQKGTHPYLFRMKQGYQEFLLEPGKGRFGQSEISDARGYAGKYLHMQFTSKAYF